MMNKKLIIAGVMATILAGASLNSEAAVLKNNIGYGSCFAIGVIFD